MVCTEALNISTCSLNKKKIILRHSIMSTGGFNKKTICTTDLLNDFFVIIIYGNSTDYIFSTKLCNIINIFFVN